MDIHQLRSGGERWTVPHAADTTYLTHGYFRYIGKFPPQIASKLIDDFYPGQGGILDPMVGGGTVLTESVLRGIECEGWDVNPVSLAISRSVARSVNPTVLRNAVGRLLAVLEHRPEELALFRTVTAVVSEPLKLKYCREYFSEMTLTDLTTAFTFTRQIALEDEAVAELLNVAVLSTLRKISFANVKKMNLELDIEKRLVSTLTKELNRSLPRIVETNESLPPVFGRGLARVREQNALDWNHSRQFGMICIHPPYLTNTAFSEATQLQLAVLGVDHKSIWTKELRCRGSFLHEPNGLKKYLVWWASIIRNAAEALSPSGALAVVVGDGQIDYVRIPVGSITVEFAADVGLRLKHRAFHELNNHTGQTQNKKMKGQHVLVFERQ